LAKITIKTTTDKEVLFTTALSVLDVAYEINAEGRIEDIYIKKALRIIR